LCVRWSIQKRQFFVIPGCLTASPARCAGTLGNQADAESRKAEQRELKAIPKRLHVSSRGKIILCLDQQRREVVHLLVSRFPGVRVDRRLDRDYARLGVQAVPTGLGQRH